MAHFLIHIQRQAARSAVFLFYLCNVWKFLSMWMYCNAVNLFFWAVFVDLILYECHTRSISVVHPLCMYGERSSVKQLSFLVWLFLSWSGHLQEKRSVIGWFVRNRLAFLWISVGQSKIKYVKMWKDVPNRRNSNVPLVDNDLRRIVQRLERHAKDDGVEGAWFLPFVKCSFIESDVDALFDRFGKNETVLLLVYDERNDAAEC